MGFTLLKLQAEGVELWLRITSSTDNFRVFKYLSLLAQRFLFKYIFK